MADFYVDAVFGNDASDGLTSSTPIRTLAYLYTLLMADAAGGGQSWTTITDADWAATTSTTWRKIEP